MDSRICQTSTASPAEPGVFLVVDNEAERAIRKAVLWRKGSFGAQSEAGCRFVERSLTLAGTARRRGINLLEWLTRAVQANLEGLPAPAFA